MKIMQILRLPTKLWNLMMFEEYFEEFVEKYFRLYIILVRNGGDLYANNCTNI